MSLVKSLHAALAKYKADWAAVGRTDIWHDDHAKRLRFKIAQAEAAQARRDIAARRKTIKRRKKR